MDSGLVYQVDGDYTPLDADRAFFFAAASAEAHQSRRVSTEMLETLEDLTRHGPDREEVARARARRIGWTEEPEELRGPSLLWTRAWRILLGDEPATVDSLRAEYDAAGPGEVREALEAAMENGRVIVSPQVRGFDDPLTRPDLPAEGRRFKRKGAVPHPFSRVKTPPSGAEALVIGEQGLSVAKGGHWVTLNRADLAVTEWSPGPVVHLYGTSGRWLHVDTREWSRPEAVLRALDRLVPSDTDIPPRRGDHRTWRPSS